MPLAEAFFQAVKAGDRAAVMALLSQEPGLMDRRDPAGSSPVQVACYYGHREIGELLLARGEHADLWDACTIGDVDVVRSWVDARPECVDQLSGDGFLPLCLAAAFGYAEIIEVLIEAGANVNLRSRSLGQVAPIDSAVFGRNAKIVERLLKSGADPNAAQEGGFAPLHGAAQNGDLEIVKLLVKYGADPMRRSDDGRTPGDVAVQAGHPEVVESLMTK